MKSVDNVLVPQYNKSLRGGRGDREAESQWINAKGKKIRKEKKENCITTKKSAMTKQAYTEENMPKQGNRQNVHRRDRLK